MSSFSAVRIDEVQARSGVYEEAEWLALRDALGVRAFGVNAWRAPHAGAEVIERHDEDEHEELYVVIRGRARFEIDGESVDAPAGTAVFVREPGASRRAIADEEGTLVLTVGAAPGKPFEPSEWELRELS